MSILAPLQRGDLPGLAKILEDFIRREQPWEFTADVFTAYATASGNDEYAREREAAWNTIRELDAWWNKRKHDVDRDEYEASRQ